MTHNLQEVIDGLHDSRNIVAFSPTGTQRLLERLEDTIATVRAKLLTYDNDHAQAAQEYLERAQNSIREITGNCIVTHNNASEDLITRIKGSTGYASFANTEGKHQSDDQSKQVPPAAPTDNDTLEIKADAKLGSPNNSTPQNRAPNSQDPSSKSISEKRAFTTRINELFKIISISDQLGVNSAISMRLLLQKLAEIEENCVTESTIAYKNAAARAQKVNSIKQYKSKTISSDHNQTLSGWSTRRPKGFHTPNDNDVLRVTEIISHPRRSSGCRDHGITGRAFASHCERQQAIIAKESLIGVSRPLCRDCPGWFRKYAKHNERIWYVTEPNGTWVFWHDGAVTMPGGNEVKPDDPIPGKYWN